MNAFYGLTFQHRTIARRMEAMVVKDVEDYMRRLTAGKRIPIRAIAELVKPISDTRRLDGRERDLSVARRNQFTIWTFTILTFI